MAQRNIWMLYLSIGLIISLLSSCHEGDSDYVINADIVYKNDTHHTVKYFQNFSSTNQRVFVFELQPNAEKKIEVRAGEGGDETLPEIDDYKGIFEGFQGNDGVLIQYDDIKCLTYESGEGSTTENLQLGYMSRRISDRHYEFVYVFSNEEYANASTCVHLE